MKTRGENKNEGYLLKLPAAQGRTQAIMAPDIDKRGGGTKIKAQGKPAVRSRDTGTDVQVYFTSESEVRTEEDLISVLMTERKRRQLAGLMDHIARKKETRGITRKIYTGILENAGLIKRGDKNITKQVLLALSELAEMAATRVIVRETERTMEYPLLQVGAIDHTSGVIEEINIGSWWFDREEYLKLPEKKQKGVTYFIKVVEGLDPGIQVWFKRYHIGKRGDIDIPHETFAKVTGLESSLEKNPRRTITRLEEQANLCLQAETNPDHWSVERKGDYSPKGSLIVKKIKQKTKIQTRGGVC